MRKEMKPMRGVGSSPRILACADAKAEGKILFFHELISSFTDVLWTSFFLRV
jgi:hypothetical protein